MSQKIAFVGLDVDDKAYHVCVVFKDTGEMVEFKTLAAAEDLVKKFKKIQEQGYEIRCCYEAGFLGFSLFRSLRLKGIFCEVIAPSLIPEIRGGKVKTDRLDARKLATLYMSGLLTAVRVPEEEDEIHRDLVRSRNFLKEQEKCVKQHIVSLCKRQGHDYRKSENKVEYWTQVHLEWLQRLAYRTPQALYALNLGWLLRQLEQTQQMIQQYDQEIFRLAATDKYGPRVKALVCFRGIDVRSAMNLICEIGDVKRFSHPNQLTSFAGLDIIEYSSGGKERKYKITKQGNSQIRTSIVEASQFALMPPRISKGLAKRRADASPKIIDIADRCMNRLYKKSSRLLYAGKHRNKVKVAAAREMLGFVWEALKNVS